MLAFGWYATDLFAVTTFWSVAKYLVRLHKLEDSQAVRIAEVYSLWEGMHPEAFDMATHDPVRNHVLTRMLAEARGQGAKKRIQLLIDRFAGERAMFQKPTDIPRKYELDP